MNDFKLMVCDLCCVADTVPIDDVDGWYDRHIHEDDDA